MNKISLSTAIYYLKQYERWELEGKSLRFHHYRTGYWVDFFEFPTTIYAKDSNEIVYRPNRFTQLFMRYYINKLRKKVEKLRKYVTNCNCCGRLYRTDHQDRMNKLCMPCICGLTEQSKARERDRKQVELIKKAISELEEEKQKKS